MKYGVSLYCYQTAIENKKMNLEDCLKAVQALPGHVDGIEVLMRRKDIPQSGYRGVILEDDQARFRELMEQYHMVPTCYDSTAVNPAFDMSKGLRRFTNPSKTVYDEQMAILKSEIDFGAGFGFTSMRAPNVYGFYEEVIRDSLLYARDKNIRLCAEIHAPMTITGDIITPYVEMVDKTCPEGGGVIPDFGIFARRLPRPGIRKALEGGADPELVAYIEKTYAEGGDMRALHDEISAKTSDPNVLSVLRKALFSVNESPEDLKCVAKYIRHVHVKFYEVDENGEEQGIDFRGALKALRECGYDGYLSSEYEGHSFYEKEDPNEVEQVRRQIVMTQKLLSEL